MRFRKKPVTVEAWQIGSDEPMPEFAHHWTDHFSDPFKMDKLLGGWLLPGVAGFKLTFMSDSDFRATYEPVEEE